MSPAGRLYLGAVEKIAVEADPAGALRWLKRSLEAGHERPSDALREPAFAPLRRDPAMRAELRELLSAHARESEVDLVAPDEPGSRLRLTVGVTDRESGEPLTGVRVHVHQTDAQGDYAPEAEEPGGGSGNPRLFAYLRTDAHGRVTLRSVLPGPYRGTRAARHVHLRVDRPGAAAFGTAIYFDADPPPDEELRAEEASGRIIVVPLDLDGETWRARARLRVPRP